MNTTVSIIPDFITQKYRNNSNQSIAAQIDLFTSKELKDYPSFGNRFALNERLSNLDLMSFFTKKEKLNTVENHSLSMNADDLNYHLNLLSSLVSKNFKNRQRARLGDPIQRRFAVSMKIDSIINKLSSNFQRATGVSNNFLIEPIQCGLLKADNQSIERYSAQPTEVFQDAKVYDFSDKLGIIRKNLKEANDHFASIFRENIKNDEWYRGAQGVLVEMLRSHIKNVKKDLNISDHELHDAYSKLLGGSGKYITVGKGSSNGLLRGTSDELDDDLKTYYNAGVRNKLELYKHIIGNLEGGYKIHLMPENLQQYLQIVKDLIILSKENEEFKNSLRFFKLYTDINFDYPRAGIAQHLQEHSCDGVVPIIVLYPGAGKENAQKILDIIYEKFGTLEGLDCPPCFNEKVTSLIYFAQGNRNQKTDKDYEGYFSSTGVYYGMKLNNRPSYTYRLRNPKLEELLNQYIYAVAENHSIEEVKSLIKGLKKMNFSKKCADRLGCSLLDYAYLFKNQHVIDMLLISKASRSALCPIRLIEEQENDLLKQILLENNNWNSVDEQGNSLIYYGLKFGNSEAIKYLLQIQSVNPSPLNNAWKTPLNQFLIDVNKGLIVLSKNHEDAFETLLRLRPGLSKNIPKIDNDEANPIKTQLIKLIQEHNEWIYV